MCVGTCKYNKDGECGVLGNVVPHDALCQIGQKEVEHFIEESTKGENHEERNTFAFTGGLSGKRRRAKHQNL